jgi:lipoyl(octanoyl) transferase
MSISRGGKATYHGPEQLVAYPIINLKDDTLKIKPKDIHAYLRILEKVLILVLNDFSITAEQREQQSVENTGRRLSYTGVWVGDYKIASIGIAVKKWTAYHGFALNINHDEQAFNGIKACGFQAQTMTNMENLLGRKLNYHEISLSVQKHFKNQLFKN